MLEFEVLGPLVVRGGEGTIPVAGARRRALLVRLLVAANELVPASRLVEDLWAEEASAATASTLQSHISLLRKVLGPGRLVGRDGGYELHIADDELDARRFETEARQARHALGTGDPATAAKLLRSALDRWHGDALADVSGAPWARPEQARLEELRLGVLEMWLEARLELGQHEDVVALAEAAVADHPLREQIWAHLMLALYRSGRQSDALRAYQRLRTHLGEELGIEPSAQLVALDDAIVQQKPELQWSGSGTVPAEGWRWQRATTPGGLPAVSGGLATESETEPSTAPPGRHHNLPAQISSFVGRAQERRAVRSLIESHRLVTLAGPGGRERPGSPSRRPPSCSTPCATGSGSSNWRRSPTRSWWRAPVPPPSGWPNNPTVSFSTPWPKRCATGICSWPSTTASTCWMPAAPWPTHWGSSARRSTWSAPAGSRSPSRASRSIASRPSTFRSRPRNRTSRSSSASMP